MSVKVAVVQMDPQLGACEQNRTHISALFEKALAQGTQLTVFPECATTGYGFADLASAREVAETVPGPDTSENM